MKYIYSVWFRDVTRPDDDQDYEWVACFLVEAVSAKAAKAWADHLSHRRERDDAVFLRSSLEEQRSSHLDTSGLPLVTDGVDSDDAHIGW